MMAFVIVAILMMASALFFILPALLRKNAVATGHVLRNEVNLAVLRDQLRELDADLAAGTIDATAYASARQELERRVVEDVQPDTASNVPAPARRWTALVIGVAVPIAAVLLYLAIGSLAGLDPAQREAQKDPAPQVTEEQIVKMVAGLAQRLKSKPDDVEGWHMLARSYNMLGRFAEAAEAYKHVIKLQPGNAGLLADYADVLGMTQGQSLQGEPEKLIASALAIDAKNIKALSLSGSAAFERHDYLAAAGQWKKILPLVPPESETARSAMSSIGEAQRLAGGGQATEAPATAVVSAPQSTAATASTEVAGTVELDTALRARVADTDTVFIFARAAQGPRFPLAVLRKQVKDLPVSFVLDDSMSMVPDAKLSNYPMVVVGARISKTGNATPGAGDFEGVTEAVATGTRGLKIRIDSQRK